VKEKVGFHRRNQGQVPVDGGNLTVLKTNSLVRLWQPLPPGRLIRPRALAGGSRAHIPGER